ncbi:MAG TPA: transposase [Kofleriaceae bacterium]|nr:transposase [Kofleriaceae bacterium]
MVFRTHGGKRAGAGRKPKGPRAGASHAARPAHDPRHPVHVTIRVVGSASGLRRKDMYLAVREATIVTARRDDFRIVHMSIQRDHIHLIVESDSKAALSKGVHASEEQIHHWKSVTVVAETRLFGDVEIKATAHANGNVQALSVAAKGKTIAVPAKWIASLPPLRLASLEVRSEVGYDPQPWLYVVFDRGLATRERIHIAFQGGKLAHATLTTVDAKGNVRHEQRKAP